MSDVPDRWEPADSRFAVAGATQEMRTVTASAGTAEAERGPSIDSTPTDPRGLDIGRSTPDNGHTITLTAGLPASDSAATEAYPAETAFVETGGETQAIASLIDEHATSIEEGMSMDSQSSRHVTYRQEDPFPTKPSRRRIPIWLLALVPIAFCLLMGVAAAGFVYLQPLVLGGPTPTATRPPLVTGTAKQEFRLRAAPRSDAEQRAQIPTGTALRLVDSAGGEILDAGPKWYLVQTLDGRNEGWAYAGWINR